MLDPLLAAVGRARTRLKKAGEEAADDFVGGYRTAPAKAKKVHDDITKDVEKAAKEQAKAAEKAARDEARAYEYVYRIKQRYLEQEEKAAEKALRKRQEQQKTVLGAAGRTFVGMTGKAAGVAGEFARGAGVKFDVAGMVGNAVSAEAAATQLSSSAYMPGEKGAAGQRQDPKKLLGEIRDVADQAAVSVESAMGGLQSFVGKTGDLETGRAVLKDLAILSKATGTNLDDMVSAAGDVANSLGDVPNKGERVLGVMRAIAGQGKLGAVEIKDLATKMARLSAAAPQYAGDVGENLAKLGALAQLSRQKGGAASAGEAVNSVARMTDTLKTPARLKQFMAQGGLKQEDIFDKKTGLLNDPFVILKKSIASKGNDPVGFAKMWSSVIGKKPAEALVNTYRQAGGGEKGMNAIDEELGKLMKASMGKGEIADSFAARMQNTDSKVQLLNNTFERIAASTAERVLPELEKLAPTAVRATEGLAGLAVYVAQNPLKSAIFGMTAALGKEVAAAGIKNILGDAMGGGLGKALSGALVGAALTIAVTEAVINVQQQAADNTQKADIEAINTRGELRAKREAGKLTAGDISSAQAQASSLEQRINATNEPWYTRGFTSQGSIYGLLSGAASWVTSGSVGAGSFGQQAQKEADREGLAVLKEDLAALKAEIARGSNGVQKVQVVGGLPGTPMGGPAHGATTGP